MKLCTFDAGSGPRVGVVRNQMPAVDRPGPRDSAVFSIVPDEWPSVRAGLEARLAGG